jgi:hypothetical protein
MWFSLVTLAIATFTLAINPKLTDEITRLLLVLLGLFSLLLSLVCAPWFMKLLIVGIVLAFYPYSPSLAGCTVGALPPLESNHFTKNQISIQEKNP